MRFFVSSLMLVSLVIFLAPFNALCAEVKPFEFTIDGKPVPKIVARVNGADIEADILYREMLAFRLMSAQRGQQIQKEHEGQIARDLLDKEIEKELFYQKARLKNIMIPSEAIQNEIKKMETQFPSKEMFESALKVQNLNRGSLHEKIEKHLVAEIYLRQEIIPLVHVDEKAAEQYYQENEDNFIHPEMYQLSHIFIATLDPRRQGKSDNPKDQEKANRMLQGINADAKTTAEDILAQLKSGADYAELAKKYSEDKETREEGGALGQVFTHSTIPEIASAMQTMKVGEISDLVKSSYGYHILKLYGKTPSKKTPYPEVKADIMNILMRKETEKIKNQMLADLKKLAKIETFIKE
jgi:parvulin-like peptidyl-prolyl isomerase